MAASRAARLVRRTGAKAAAPRAAVKVEGAGGRIEIFRGRAIVLPSEEVHRDERVEEVADAALVQAKFPTEFRAGNAAIAKFAEHAELDGSEKNFRRPESESRLENGAGIKLRVHTIHKSLCSIKK
jgi:hypothetical protein